MSYSANHKNIKKSINYLEKQYLEDNIQRSISYKRESSKKDKSRLTIANINNQFIQKNFSNSSINTNISIIKEDKKDISTYNSYPIIPIIENDFDKNFIQKRRIIYKSPSIINNRIISFQKQKNKQILEFSLFDDKLIFKDINRSYLQDEHSDDGSESSDEKINDGRIFLTQELEDSVKQMSKSLLKNQNQKLLSRRMRFKNENV